MKPVLGLFGLLLVAAAATGCVTMSVSSSLQPGVTFSQYHTWDWGPADKYPVGDPRLENNTIFRDHLEGAIAKALAARGFERAATGARADFVLHYHASVNQRFEVNEPDRTCTDCKASVIEYDQGTLVIDMMEPVTDKLLWRGWAQDSVQGVVDDQPLMERKLDEAVAKIMARFPTQ